MKFLKYAFLTLVIATVADIAIVLAYPDVYGTVINTELKGNEAEYTGIYTKHTWSPQTYENINTFTWLTNPCPKCQVAIKPYTADGDYGATIFTTKGQTKHLADTQGFNVPNDFKLKIWRHDITMIPTSHLGNWIINA